ncbi:hypothetical protein DV736_g4739, partial [Chaetothyriales sp. CBS 134916]
MAQENWTDLKQRFVRWMPDLLVKRELNFITIHYIYIISTSLVLSLIIWGIGDMAYIDALFFATGSCTQSGLNTIDIDLLRTGQQFCFYLGAMLCNPIVIHSTVVFVRLYWFEKRFKDVVTEARALRRSRTRGHTTMEKEDPEQGRREMGVRGRAIKVLSGTGRFGFSNARGAEEGVAAGSKAIDSSDEVSKTKTKAKANGDDHDVTMPHPSRSSDDDEELRLPQQLSPEQNIRFLEQQRNESDSGILHIPSPREFERGGRPENVEDLAAQGKVRRASISRTNQEEPINADGPRPGHRITINEPHVRRDRDKVSHLPRADSGLRTLTRDHDEHGFQPHTRLRRPSTLSNFHRTATTRSIETAPYLSYQPTVGRNSFFVNLTQAQREELGGIEYRALKTLAWILVLYFFCFHILGFICLVPWIMHTRTYGKVVNEQGQGRVWWGFFTSASMFNDLGFTLTNNSMLGFQFAILPLLLGSFLIVIGNTGFPCMLRFCIWAASAVVPNGSSIWEELRFLLDHPRRCFTLLFPAGATWWLFTILVILNGVDLIFFIILDLHDPVVTSMPSGIRLVDGLFQATSTRTAGFAVVNLADLHPAIQVSYLIMMYISVFPIAISMRRTNVYEERSLGIYASGAEEDEADKEPSYVAAHLRRQLSFDLWYVFLGLFIIAIVEGPRLQDNNDYGFTLFAVLFEIVSAYGTVGLSLGYPTINASFSAEFKVLSKLIIIAMQVRGRHRGLPYQLDRAVLLPSESLHAKEEKDAQRMLQRRRSSVVTVLSARDENTEARCFRPETGITSGFEPETQDGNSGQRTKRESNQKKEPRRSSGNMRFKLFNIPDIPKGAGKDSQGL